MSDHQNNNDAIRGFAKGGIAAAITINSGALIASLSQADHLLNIVGKLDLANAITAWAAGVATAAVAWVFAILAASAFANGWRKSEITAAGAGIIALLFSIGSFFAGFLSISYGIRS